MDGKIYLDWLPLTYDKYENMSYLFHEDENTTSELSYSRTQSITF